MEKETASLPIGPVETSREWFAPYRLGRGSGSAVVWTKDTRRVFHLLSRVLEHSTLYAVSCLNEILSTPDLGVERCKKLVLWTDGCRQFKSRAWVGSVGLNALERFNIEGISTQCGCPKDFKP